ncbi:hypothetical protein GCM10010531_12970 [Blastococcus jejuensis]|uniref:Uncharacterized protein n=1 Tax=Blastococcus jejuensis TaxID=351224 RepID=A0ABP6NYY7_9ACTN
MAASAAPAWARAVAVGCAVLCGVVVGIAGELSAGALVAVGIAAAVVVTIGLRRRAGAAARPVGRAGLPWLAWLAAPAAWEAVALADDRTPTLSDLLDPVLAQPAVRAAATLCWLAAGAWLVRRPALTLRVVPAPRRRIAPLPEAVAAAMRTASGRVAVLLAWSWIGVHFLAR